MTLRWLNPALSRADQGQERATGPTISSSGSAICGGHVVRQLDWATALKPWGLSLLQASQCPVGR